MLKPSPGGRGDKCHPAEQQRKSYQTKPNQPTKSNTVSISRVEQTDLVYPNLSLILQRGENLDFFSKMKDGEHKRKWCLNWKFQGHRNDCWAQQSFLLGQSIPGKDMTMNRDAETCSQNHSLLWL